MCICAIQPAIYTFFVLFPALIVLVFVQFIYILLLRLHFFVPDKLRILYHHLSKSVFFYASFYADRWIAKYCFMASDTRTDIISSNMQKLPCEQRTGTMNVHQAQTISLRFLVVITSYNQSTQFNVKTFLISSFIALAKHLLK